MSRGEEAPLSPAGAPGGLSTFTDGNCMNRQYHRRAPVCKLRCKALVETPDILPPIVPPLSLRPIARTEMTSSPKTGMPNGSDVFRLLVEGVSDHAIFMLDPQGQILSWNPGAERLKGYRADEIIGSHFSRFYTPEAQASGWPGEELRRAEQFGRFEDEGWRVRKDGSRFWANVVITALRGPDGALLGFSKITRDLTERREHEERLRQSEERFRLLVEMVEDYAIVMLDPNGFITSWNVGAQRIEGYTAGEVLGKHVSMFYTPEAIEQGAPQRELEVAAKVGRFENDGWRVRRDGSLIWANIVITAMFDGKGALRGFSTITRNLTERRAQELKLKESEENFRLLIEGVKDHAIFLLDSQGSVVSWNAGAERVKGYRAEEVIGRHYSIFFVDEDIAAGKPERELEVATALGFSEDTGWRVRRDGSRFWADVTITALRDKDGTRHGFAQITRDLSERRRVQELETEGKRINEFIAMLAHELRNPLAPIRNAVEIMDRKAISPELAWCKDLIGRQVGHLARLVDDLLDVSRITSGKIQLDKVPLDLNAVVAAAIESMRPVVAAYGHVLEVRLPPQPVRVTGDPTRLTQVIVNLVSNAAKYTPNGGKVEVELEPCDDDARLRVIDNGIGMSKPMLEHAFDLFVQGERTLDRADGGLGVGLTLVRRIVALHGGSINAASAGAGQGSEFVVELPLADGDDAAAESRGEPVQPVVARRILVVDDNVDAALSLSALLEMSGHQVSLAHDGSQALDLAAEQRPDLILLDVGLPGIDGYEVARRVRQLPALDHTRLIAMTGYGQDSDKQAAADAGFDAHIVKPVEYPTLMEAIEGLRP